MPYSISTVAFKSFDNDFQNLAVGMIDGGIVIIDLILWLEKYFLEKHPAKITSMAFHEYKSLISVSVDGRVNISDLVSLEKK